MRAYSKLTAQGQNYSSEDVHQALFAKTPKRRTLKELKEGIRRYVQGRHAGR